MLTDQMGREQLKASGEEKVDPMIASLLLVNRLREPWGLSDPGRTDAPEGKMAQLWDKNSGLPPKNEREAIEQRRGELKGKIKTSTVAVLPVHVGGKSDRQAAVALAAMMTSEGLGRAQISTADPKLQVDGNTNELRILWDTARALQDFLRKNPQTATTSCSPITAQVARPTAGWRSTLFTSSSATGTAIGCWSSWQIRTTMIFSKSIHDRPTIAIAWSCNG